jgi:hypothetical protein
MTPLFIVYAIPRIRKPLDFKNKKGHAVSSPWEMDLRGLLLRYINLTARIRWQMDTLGLGPEHATITASAVN